MDFLNHAPYKILNTLPDDTQLALTAHSVIAGTPNTYRLSVQLQTELSFAAQLTKPLLTTVGQWQKAVKGCTRQFKFRVQPKSYGAYHEHDAWAEGFPIEFRTDAKCLLSTVPAECPTRFATAPLDNWSLGLPLLASTLKDRIYWLYQDVLYFQPKSYVRYVATSLLNGTLANLPSDHKFSIVPEQYKVLCGFIEYLQKLKNADLQLQIWYESAKSLLHHQCLPYTLTLTLSNKRKLTSSDKWLTVPYSEQTQVSHIWHISHSDLLSVLEAYSPLSKSSAVIPITFRYTETCEAFSILNGEQTPFQDCTVMLISPVPVQFPVEVTFDLHQLAPLLKLFLSKIGSEKLYAICVSVSPKCPAVFTSFSHSDTVQAHLMPLFRKSA